MEIVDINHMKESADFWERIFAENGFHHLADTMIITDVFAEMFPPLTPDLVDKVSVHIAPWKVVMELENLPRDRAPVMGIFFKGKMGDNGVVV